MDLGISLKTAIFNKGIRSKDLAKFLGTQPQQVTNWKRTGAIQQSTLIKICEFFEMEVSEFIALGEEKSSQK